MLEIDVFNRFIGEVNKSHQQFCLWFQVTNNFAKHQRRWNEQALGAGSFSLESFSKEHGCRYKNFWEVTMVSLQHEWILSAARLFDPAFNARDKDKKYPRVSLMYILGLLEDNSLKISIEREFEQHKEVVSSIKNHRDNYLAHNDLGFSPSQIEAGTENLYEWLEGKLEEIKEAENLKSTKAVNTKYNEKLAEIGVKEVFDDLIFAEKNQES